MRLPLVFALLLVATAAHAAPEPAKVAAVVAVMEAEELGQDPLAAAGQLGLTVADYQSLRDLLIAGHVARAHDAGRHDILLDEVRELLPEGYGLDDARAAAAPHAARLDRLNVLPAKP